MKSAEELKDKILAALKTVLPDVKIDIEADKGQCSLLKQEVIEATKSGDHSRIDVLIEDYAAASLSCGYTNGALMAIDKTVQIIEAFFKDADSN